MADATGPRCSTADLRTASAWWPPEPRLGLPPGLLFWGNPNQCVAYTMSALLPAHKQPLCRDFKHACRRVHRRLKDLSTAGSCVRREAKAQFSRRSCVGKASGPACTRRGLVFAGMSLPEQCGFLRGTVQRTGPYTHPKDGPGPFCRCHGGPMPGVCPVRQASSLGLSPSPSAPIRTCF